LSITKSKKLRRKIHVVASREAAERETYFLPRTPHNTAEGNVLFKTGRSSITHTDAGVNKPTQIKRMHVSLTILSMALASLAMEVFNAHPNTSSR
jgi:hypothetical protein